MKFTALIYLSYHTAGFISRGFQSTVHVGNVRQTAIIEDIQTTSKVLFSIFYLIFNKIEIFRR